MHETAPARDECALPRVLVRGAGDLATGAAIRLFRCGFPVVMTEIERPLMVRRSVAFAQAVYDGETVVEGVRAVRCTLEHIAQLDAGVIPVLVDPDAACGKQLRPGVVVDAIMAKRNTGTRMHDAGLVIALGPGFTAGVDCHAVVETNRGHNLGRVLWQGSAEADTGRPGALPGVHPGAQRALYAPVDGHVLPRAEIGDRLRAGEVIAVIESPGGGELPIEAAFDGVLRGLIHPAVHVTEGMKIGDVDPRIQPAYCFSVSDKSLAIGGGVLEAVLTHMHRMGMHRSGGQQRGEF